MPFCLLKGIQGNAAEALERASHYAGFLVDDLKAALAAAGPVESLLVTKQLEKAVALQREIDALRAALPDKGAST